MTQAMGCGGAKSGIGDGLCGLIEADLFDCPVKDRANPMIV